MQLSRIGYYSDFFVYPVIIATLGAVGMVVGGTERSALWPLICAACVAIWTLLEYLLHRFVLHHVPWVKEMHHEHHIEEKAQIGTPTWLSLGAFAIIVFAPAYFLSDFFVTSAVTSGLMIGYLWYISVHHILHHWHFDHSSYVYGLKRRHALHHHFDKSANFGVTSNFWDHVFGTAVGSPERGPQPH